MTFNILPKKVQAVVWVGWGEISFLSLFVDRPQPKYNQQHENVNTAVTNIEKVLIRWVSTWVSTWVSGWVSGRVRVGEWMLFKAAVSNCPTMSRQPVKSGPGARLTFFFIWATTDAIRAQLDYSIQNLNHLLRKHGSPVLTWNTNRGVRWDLVHQVATNWALPFLA